MFSLNHNSFRYMGGWYRDFIPKVELLPSRRRYSDFDGNVKQERDDYIHIGFPSGNQAFTYIYFAFYYLVKSEYWFTELDEIPSRFNNFKFFI